MTSASKYWEFVKLDATSKRRVEMITLAKTYFQKHFPDLQVVTDTVVQRQFWQVINQSTDADVDDKILSQLCLRCYISQQIYQVCLDLAMKFGSKNGFGYQDLLPFVLDDEVLAVITRQPQQQLPQQLGSWLNSYLNNQSSQYQSLATNILKTFDPSKGSLSAWVGRYVKQQPELKRFLLQHGVFLVSDWALLNDTNPKELQRILTNMFRLSGVEIDQACGLLVSYHRVYRQDRLQQRLAGGMLKCQPPTTQQLARIANDLRSQTGKAFSPEVVFKQLQILALRLRQYRIAAQGGAVAAVSLDREEVRPMVEATEASQSANDDDEQLEFVRLYQKQFLQALDMAIAQVLTNVFAKLQRKRGMVEQQFTQALHLFHCQGQSMSQIAPVIGLKKQYEVTRLLKLNELRADIRQQLLLILRSRVLELAENFADSSRLQDLDNKLEVILDEQISTLIQEIESEAKNPVRNQPLRSLLARRICSYLQTSKGLESTN